MGPLSAKSYPGSRPVRPAAGAGGGRAVQEIDYGRRGAGYVFGAFVPADGAALTAPSAGRTTAAWIDFLGRVEAWPDPAVGRVYAVLDNPSMHRALDVLLFALAHPRWACVFRPASAAYPNLIEPWWKTLRSLALKGRRFETWAEVCEAVEQATAYWNAHRRPSVWGHRRRHRARRQAAGGRMPLAP